MPCKLCSGRFDKYMEKNLDRLCKCMKMNFRQNSELSIIDKSEMIYLLFMCNMYNFVIRIRERRKQI